MTPRIILIALGAILWATDISAALADDWALKPISSPPVPQLSQGDWARNDIDRFVLQGLERKGLKPSSEADRATLIRRLSFDLVGLPPSPKEVEDFVSDKGDRAYERLVNRLLDSPHYGERWGRHWLDVARYTESQGFEYDRLRDNAWHYRDYVINSFNSDKPYDQFVREQIAGDVIEPVNSDGIVATSLLVCGPYDQAGNSQQNKTQRKITREEEMDDLVSVVSQTFLGMTINCARCHAHKYDPIPQEDYFRVKAVFDGVIHGEREVVSKAEREAAEKKSRELDAKMSEVRGKMTALREIARKRLNPDQSKGNDLNPMARWSFEGGTSDLVGKMHGQLQGGAKVERGRLILNGKGQFLQTASINRSLKAKTLAAWVQLSTLGQGGGGVISIQRSGGKVFDSIVYAEREGKKWMSGSEGYARSTSVSGYEEKEATEQLVHLAIVYAADRSITIYRNGKPYGKPYQASSLVDYKAGQAEVLIGSRHSGGGRAFLSGEVEDASLFDRALTASEISELAVAPGYSISEEVLLAKLTDAERTSYAALNEEADKLAGQSRAVPKSFKSYVGRRRQPSPTHRLIRGSVKSPAETVSPRGLSAIENPSPDFGLKPDAPEAERRRKFAEWVTHPDNPLPARAMANRIWHYHFGRGIVETPNDLGAGGVPPTHPELLDWLATQFKTGGWSVKNLHRVIVSSATYRQSSELNEKGAKVDAGNQFYWRYAPRRLEAEAVRDAMLSVSGQLNPQMGGPSFRPFRTSSYGSVFYHLEDRSGSEYNRRTIYRIHVNSGKDPLLDAFDCPDPSVKTPARMSTVTPLQALGLMNNPFVQRQALHLSERALKEADGNVSGTIDRMYQYAFGRTARETEVERASQLANEHGMKEVAWALLNATEFLYVR